jgi:methionyl-tRNA formyltransferase
MMKIIFCGTPQFAVPTLERLIKEGFSIELVVTNPDEPSGRGLKLKPSPVKELAEHKALKVYQPARLKDPDVQAFISQYQTDAIVVVAYGHLIPRWMIELPRLGCINLHASLLPKYRGASPIAWAIARGERVTGITTMRIDTGLDTGDILLQREEAIHDDDTTVTLSDRLSLLGADLMVETLRALELGVIIPQSQDSSLASFAPMLKKEDGEIEWVQTAEEIARLVRGLYPWPGTYTHFRGRNLHLWAAQPATSPAAEGSTPGDLLIEQGRLFAVCGGATLLNVLELQLEGRKRLSARDFINGVRLTPGERFGE